MAEYEFEPVPGLPERLPSGEAQLWQGAPRWQSLARHAFHTRAVALYFIALVLLSLGWKLWAGEPLSGALDGVFWLTVLGTLAVGLLLLLAWAMSRATLYTITNRRLVLRFGVALPIATNIPFNQITNAGLRLNKDGSGDIPLTLSDPVRAGIRAGYVILWPHAQPWYFVRPRPMLRSVPEAATVAKTLAAALAAAHATQSDDAEDQPQEAPAIVVGATETRREPTTNASLY